MALLTAKKGDPPSFQVERGGRKGGGRERVGGEYFIRPTVAGGEPQKCRRKRDFSATLLSYLLPYTKKEEKSTKITDMAPLLRTSTSCIPFLRPPRRGKNAVQVTQEAFQSV